MTRSSNLNKIKEIRSRREQFKYSFFPFWTNSGLSTWENCLPWDFDNNSIQNTNILGGDIRIVAIYKIRPNNSNIATELVFPWIFVAMTKINY